MPTCLNHMKFWQCFCRLETEKQHLSLDVHLIHKKGSHNKGKFWWQESNHKRLPFANCLSPTKTFQMMWCKLPTLWPRNSWTHSSFFLHQMKKNQTDEFLKRQQKVHKTIKEGCTHLWNLLLVSHFDDETVCCGKKNGFSLTLLMLKPVDGWKIEWNQLFPKIEFRRDGGSSELCIVQCAAASFEKRLKWGSWFCHLQPVKLGSMWMQTWIKNMQTVIPAWTHRKSAESVFASQCFEKLLVQSQKVRCQTLNRSFCNSSLF